MSAPPALRRSVGAALTDTSRHCGCWSPVSNRLASKKEGVALRTSNKDVFKSGSYDDFHSCRFLSFEGSGSFPTRLSYMDVSCHSHAVVVTTIY